MNLLFIYLFTYLASPIITQQAIHTYSHFCSTANRTNLKTLPQKRESMRKNMSVCGTTDRASKDFDVNVKLSIFPRNPNLRIRGRSFA